MMDIIKIIALVWGTSSISFCLGYWLGSLPKTPDVPL